MNWLKNWTGSKSYWTWTTAYIDKESINIKHGNSQGISAFGSMQNTSNPNTSLQIQTLHFKFK